MVRKSLLIPEKKFTAPAPAAKNGHPHGAELW
jgi:hypothetical protein